MFICTNYQFLEGVNCQVWTLNWWLGGLYGLSLVSLPCGAGCGGGSEEPWMCFSVDHLLAAVKGVLTVSLVCCCCWGQLSSQRYFCFRLFPAYSPASGCYCAYLFPQVQFSQLFTIYRNPVCQFTQSLIDCPSHFTWGSESCILYQLLLLVLSRTATDFQD